MLRCYIALGANLADPAGQVRAALAALDTLPGTRLVAASSLYASAPVGVGTDHPDYVNAVAAVDSGLAAQTLLDALLALERDFGRQRHTHLAPRTLDLDLLLHGDAIHAVAGPGNPLSVPHPRMHERAFVLVPLLEIAPDVVIPGRGPARDFLPACAGQRLHRLPA